VSESLITSAVTVIMAIIGVAIIAVLVSKQANTAGVLQSGSQGIATDLGAALSPVTGSGLFSGFSGGAL
jgi:PRD1 phage membrane DNA delivery